MQNTFGIFGYGRFGSLWASLLTRFGDVYVYDSDSAKYDHESQSVHFVANAAEVFERTELIFYAVPISNFEKTLKSHIPYIKSNHILADLLSVKLYPKQVFDQNLPQNTEAVLLHPMFGPDSVRINGIQGLPIVVDKYRLKNDNYEKLLEIFSQLGLRIIEITADDHDRLAARTQGVAHFLGRVLAEFGYESTAIDTLGAKKLKEIMDNTCNDTWQLFTDLQNKNPYTKEMREKLEKAMKSVDEKLTKVP